MRGISLFANVGIAEIGLSELGHEIVLANELIKSRADFYQYAFPNVKVIQGDIWEKKHEIMFSPLSRKIDFAIITPPCQGMSTVGRLKKHDSRNQLILPAIDIIDLIRPLYVLIENVALFPSTLVVYKGEEVTIDNLISSRLASNYTIIGKLIDTADYGIPQYRKRYIYLLTKKGQKLWLFPNAIKDKITVRQAIGDLPSLVPLVLEEKDTNKNTSCDDSNLSAQSRFHVPSTHCRRHIDIMSHTPTGKSAYENESMYIPRKENGDVVKGFGSCYKRIDWDKPSPTITMANRAISSQNNVHPGRKMENGLYSDARVLSIYELMRLHTIPDSWIVPDWATPTFLRHVIGESIPPKLIYSLFSSIPTS